MWSSGLSYEALKILNTIFQVLSSNSKNRNPLHRHFGQFIIFLLGIIKQNSP